MFSIASASKHRVDLPPVKAGQGWVVGCAGIQYFEERVCFYHFMSRGKLRASADTSGHDSAVPGRQADLCQLLFPPVSEFSSKLIEVSELEQLEHNTEEELWSIDKVAPPESLWFLNQSKKPFPSVFAHPAGRLAADS